MTNIRAKALEALDYLQHSWQQKDGTAVFDEECEEIRKALSEPKWKSMESCPKEHGVRRLFLVNGEHYFGRWYNNKSYPKLSRWGIEHYDDWADQPTHWMHLPDAPTGEKS